jgi:hypothetical protein
MRILVLYTYNSTQILSGASTCYEIGTAAPPGT